MFASWHSCDVIGVFKNLNEASAYSQLMRG